MKLLVFTIAAAFHVLTLCFLQEALAREQLLEAKLAFLQRIVGQAEKASADNWKALIDEDR
jgi:uncharacterized membrane protein